MANQTPEGLLEYAHAAACILLRCMDLYDQGETAFYRVMAVELRLLLCDTTRRHDRLHDLSLLPKVMPGLEMESLFPPGGKLPLTAWLGQEIEVSAEVKISVRQLIRQVCEQDGGAHVDQRLNSGIPTEGNAPDWIRKIAGVVGHELAVQGLCRHTDFPVE